MNELASKLADNTDFILWNVSGEKVVFECHLR